MPVVSEEELGVGRLAISPVFGIVREDVPTGLLPLSHDLAIPDVVLLGERGYYTGMISSDVVLFRRVGIEIV